ncbi:DNA topoisomerase IV [Enemella evansiae]|uniref:DNA gyrase/topoisomerase IV subunit A n=1 Tax=Enemella evansiae TaxID=2016499 RepID=UPI000B97937E|nr:DNA topoisomerase IV subunit A [Enemella evansiae]OYN98112.1 DNA topoisomerase IV [Enemella evansiae]
MARKKTEVIDDEVSEKIIDIDVSSEMQTSFLEYAYSVIYARALPDARDGLKPVQRRILFAMDEMNLRPDRAFVKCARVVGQVMGQYHPHGDSAIYDALVRLAQPWTMRLPLIDGHGNFGSPDAGPAAMRYTECRMDSPAEAMTAELDQDTVDFRPNYDGKESEPVVLPAAFPNLLVNGTTGIAVGMATNIPPHNLVEVVQALRHLLKHPNAQLDTLMRFIPGPDLPTGGKIVGLDGIADAYATGKGSFKIRATTRIEQFGRRKGIVVSELPYTIGPEKIIEQIKTLVQNKKLQGIADVKDLSDLDSGTRLVIEVKNGINPEALLEQLFRQTKLEDSYSINSVALVEGQPRTLTLHDMLTVYLEHRLQVVLRRTTYNRDRALDRLHLVEGLLIAILDIDDVIAIIRAADDAGAARSRLIEVFELTETQANYILDMQLRRLTKYSRIELESEREELKKRIAELTEIIDNDDRLRQVVNDELAEVAKKFGTPRRTVLLASSGQVTSAGPLEVADDPCWLLLSATGLIARLDGEDPLPDRESRSKHDVISSRIRATARADFGVITTAGRLIRLNAIDLPTVPRTANAPNLSGGSRLKELVALQRNERVLCLTTLDPESPGLALGTAQGVVKRVRPEVLGRDEWEVIALAPKDQLVGAVELTDETAQLVFITSDAQLLHFGADKVRPQGRTAGGMAGIKLGAGAEAVFFGAAPADGSVVVTVAGSGDSLPGTDSGSVKVTPLDSYPSKGRATGGMRCHRFLKGEDRLQLAWAGAAPAIASAGSGTAIELPEIDPRRDGSGTPAAQSIAAIASA